MRQLIFTKQDLNGKAAVYIVWSGRNDCLYVGMTANGFLRPLTNRLLRKVWTNIERIVIEWHSNSDLARDREKELIGKLHPALNKSNRRGKDEALAALKQANQDKLVAAQLLGVSRATFYRRLKS